MSELNLPYQNNEDITITSLSKEDRILAENYLAKLDINDKNLIFSFGNKAQNELRKTSENLLKTAAESSAADIDTSLIRLIDEIKDFGADVDKKSGLFGLFSSPEKERKKITQRYYETIKAITKIEEDLGRQKIALVRTITIMDGIYDTNLKNYKNLTIYLAVGNEVIKRLEEQKHKAEIDYYKTYDDLSREKISEIDDFIEKFSKRLYDIKISRLICIQTAPQIRLLQTSEKTLLSKTQSAIANTIPLWKNQTAMTLGLKNAKNAMTSLRRADEAVTDLAEKNSDEYSKEKIIALNEEIVNTVSYDLEEIVKGNKDMSEALSDIRQKTSDNP